MSRPPLLELSITSAIPRQPLTFLRRHLVDAHILLRPALREMSLALVDDRTMAGLHRQYMGLPGPTDVLTFELAHDARGRVTSGEVVVSVPHARRQALRRGLPLRNELLLYGLHGMLHLCGLDDRTDRDFVEMHRREDQILTQLGIGNVFAPPEPRHRGRRGKSQ